MSLGQTQQPAGRSKAHALPGLRLNRSTAGRKSWSALLLGVLSGLLVWLAFPPVDFGWVALFGLVPLAHVFHRWGRREVALASVTFGGSFFALLLYWIRLFGPEAFIALVILETAIVTVVLVSAKAISDRLRGIPLLLMFPISFLASEYLRGRFPFGGFTWGGLGYSQHDFEHILGVASLTGVWGISLFVAFINVLLWRFGSTILERGSFNRSFYWAFPTAILMLAPFLLTIGGEEGAPIRVAIVQGNTQEDLIDPNADDYDVLKNHIRLTGELSEDVGLVVWPESALDTDPFLHPEFGAAMQETIKSRGSYFMVGAYVEAGEREFLNQTLFFDPNAALVGSYTKRHLVPFGEYIPFRAVLEPVAGAFVEELQLVPRDGIPGSEPTVFQLPEGTVGSVICFESTFPGSVRSLVNEGARLLVVSTNNSSFKRTAASRQHVAFSQLRAAENRMWVVHAALTGISAIVTPSGQVTDRSNLFEPATLMTTATFARGKTFYARTGDWLPVGAIGLLALMGASVAVGMLRRLPVRGLTQDGSEIRPLVIIPTYQEADNIDRMIDSVLGSLPGTHLLVVDDSSPDGTGSIVAGRSSDDSRVHLLSRSQKLGLGRAYVDGFRWGLDRDFNCFIEMDADFSHDPVDLSRLVEATTEGGLVIGSRYVPGGRIEGWSPFRRGLSLAGNVYAQAVLGFEVRDSTSGFRCFRRETLEGIDLSRVRSEGYAFQIDMAYRVWKLGFSIEEIPITFRERQLGGSKMSRSIIGEALLKVTSWGLRDFLLGRRFAR